MRRFFGPTLMFKVRTYNQIAARGLTRFPSEQFEVGAHVADPDAILLRSHRLEAGELGARVTAVARAGAGVNNVPVERCTAQGVVVFNTPGANANSVKELTLAALLLAARDIAGGLEFVGSLADIQDDPALNQRVEGEKRRFKGRELYDRTLGVVGLGAIGSLVARAALDLGMQVVGFDPALSVEAAWRLPSKVQRMDNLQALLARSDYVTLHVPALADTVGMIDAAALGALRPGAALLNFARREIVVEEAVADALASGRLRMYFSDFPSTTLPTGARSRATPHLGASTTEAEENCAVMAANQLIDFLQCGNIVNSVNFPDVYLDQAEGHRIAVLNRNVPGTLGQVMSVLADANINVIDMLNKSRDDVAYNLIDIAVEPDALLLSQFEAIDSVIGARAFAGCDRRARPAAETDSAGAADARGNAPHDTTLRLPA